MSSRLSPTGREHLAAELFKTISSSGKVYADIGILEHLLIFSGTDSLSQLEGLSSEYKRSTPSSQLPAYIEKVAGVLQGFTPVPNAVGLGAFLLATFLQMMFYENKGESNPKSMLESVFAEEKATEVRNLLEEFKKRYMMYLYNDHKLLLETEKLESQLSLQLTRLRTSIDKEINSRAVKHWVNGAAFHAQMLIHIARLKKRTGAGTQAFESAKRAAIAAVDIYQNDAMQILEKYKVFKTSSLSSAILNMNMNMFTGSHVPNGPPRLIRYFTEEEIDFSFSLQGGHLGMTTDAYVDYYFLHGKELNEIKVYFVNLQKNIDVLVNQTGDFNIESKR